MENEFRAINPTSPKDADDPSDLQARPSTQQPPRSLPAALQARLAKRGIIPQATVSAPPTVTAAKKKAAANSAPRLPPKPLPAPADLQPGWRCALDPAHERVFYYNLSTGVRTWIKPSTGLPLPAGWVEVQDANTGGSYFCSVQAGQSQWHHPGAAVASAAAPVGGAAFVPCASFAGPRAGYVFKRGPQGIGYYADTPRVAVEPVARAPRPPQGGRYGRRRDDGNLTGELDPMDPAAYSDAPRGGWSRGLEVRVGSV